MFDFTATIEIIGVNPFVFVPKKILEAIFKQAGKDKGAIPVKGTLNGIPFIQTLVKFRGAWRLYINTTMLKNSPQRIGERVKLSIQFDTEPRIVLPHRRFSKALKSNKEAAAIYHGLSPSKKLEIVKYLGRLKTEEALIRNIERAINFLLGKERFIGRDRP